nr:glucose-1-phosphate adenylyltransferase subunit GlgD [Lachnospiraceae bacterium]
IKNSIILNDVYIGDNSYIENCIIETGSTISTNSRYVGEQGVRIVVERKDRYII